MLERGFLILWIFLLFFSEFSCLGRVWTEFGTKIFSLFLGLYHPVLAKNNARKRFLNFFAIFLEFCCPGRVWAEFWTKIFIFSFSSYLISFWTKIMPERGFLIFEFFCYFFRNFLPQVEYERNLGLNFFSFFHVLSHPVLAKKKNAEKSFLIFWIFLLFFFGIFKPGSSMNGIWD